MQAITVETNTQQMIVVNISQLENRNWMTNRYHPLLAHVTHIKAPLTQCENVAIRLPHLCSRQFANAQEIHTTKHDTFHPRPLRRSGFSAAWIQFFPCRIQMWRTHKTQRIIILPIICSAKHAQQVSFVRVMLKMERTRSLAYACHSNAQIQWRPWEDRGGNRHLNPKCVISDALLLIQTNKYNVNTRKNAKDFLKKQNHTKIGTIWKHKNSMIFAFA